MIASLLIANRGEIARRIIRTARKLGIRTVAVHSDVDAQMPFVREADEAVCIGTALAKDSYLRQDRILAAARDTGAEAIHPGYGFLSENAEFAEAVIAAGLVWVGAPPASIRAMGLKDAAKQRMIAAGVPVTPGYLGEDQSPVRLASEADAIGYPVLIKAVAGGGGKGMRKVDAAPQFAEMLASCQREAAASFGDDRVLIEKYILSPRHIEVQIFGDTHGNVVHLFERDCSLQRRHQKVIEEAPAPGMDAATRETITAAAVKAARAVDYVGAGTIEFIADGSEGLRADRIWFMEMNTRLQVEHPVTEAITGQDLVEWQLRVASGEPLPKMQAELAINGWAMEARLYAENPATGFLPSIGRLDYFRFPTPGTVRIDAGVEEGDAISPFYDPMIAKIISHSYRRESAASKLAWELRTCTIAPVKTNASFLVQCLQHSQFLAGEIDIGFIDRYQSELVLHAEPSQPVVELAALSLAYREADCQEPLVLLRDRKIGLPKHYKGSVWQTLAGFRNAGPPYFRIELECNGKTYVFDRLPRDETGDLSAQVIGDDILVNDNGATFLFRQKRHDGGGAGATVGDGVILAPMPGRIVSVAVAQGATVTKGQRLVVLEAMKMEQALLAPFDGIVAELKASEGAQVSEGALLARIEAAKVI